MLDIKLQGERELSIKLEGIERKFPFALRQIVDEAAYLVESLVKENISGKILKVRTGQLRRSITTQLGGSIKKPWARVGTNIIYAAIHEFGGVITPKNAPYLWFKIETGRRVTGLSSKSKSSDVWIRTTKVVIPARPYFAPAFRKALPKIKVVSKRVIDDLVGNK